jgi:hypothetical protein
VTGSAAEPLNSSAPPAAQPGLLLSRDDNTRRADRLPSESSGEAGYSLIELMLVSSLLVVVLGAVLTFGQTTQRLAPRDHERSHVIREGQIGLHRMTRELRKAHVVNARGPYFMDVQLLVNGVDTRVRYQCDVAHPTETPYRRCLRFVNGGTTGELVIDRVLNPSDSPADPVFSYTTDIGGVNVTHVEARIELPARGDLQNGHGHRITYSDGFYPRNIGA